jgi:replicative DNA helicase
VTQESNNVEDLVENLEAQLTELLDRKTQSYVKAEALVTPAIQLIEELYKNQGILGIPTGYKTVDDFTGGFISGEMTVLGARASIGKTALALNMAEKIARRGTGVGFLSLEMSGSQLMQRLLCGNSGIGMRRIRTGKLHETDFKKIVDAAEMVYAYPLYIYDQPNARLIDLKLKARRMLRSEHIKILFIDYLSLVRTEKDLARWEEVGFISSELKSLARELDIPIVVCAQVNRDAEGKAPNLSNLRESGSIEQDADVVMFLHRKRDSQNSELIIAKNRNGGTGKIDMHFNMERTRFELVEASA